MHDIGWVMSKIIKRGMFFISKMFLFCRVKMFAWKKKKLEYQHMEEKIKEVLNKKIETKRSRHGMNQNETENLIQDFTSQNNKSSEMIT